MAPLVVQFRHWDMSVDPYSDVVPAGQFKHCGPKFTKNCIKKAPEQQERSLLPKDHLIYLPDVGGMLIVTPYAKLELQYVPDCTPHENARICSPVNIPVLDISYFHKQYCLLSAYAFA